MTDYAMGGLVTADRQTRPANLSSCKTAANRMLRAVNDWRVNQVTFASDSKDAYDPINLCVQTIWRDRIMEIVKRGTFLHCAMGDHYRQSTQTGLAQAY